MHTVARRGIAADMGDDEGVARIRGGVDGPESPRGHAALDGARHSGGCGASDLRATAETKKDGRIQFAVGVSGLGCPPTPSYDSGYGAKPRLDGGGVCPASALYRREYRSGCDS